MRLTYPLDSGFGRGGASVVAAGVHRDRNLTREVIDGGGPAAKRRGNAHLPVHYIEGVAGWMALYLTTTWKQEYRCST